MHTPSQSRSISLVAAAVATMLGCDPPLADHLAGRLVTGSPFFENRDLFQEGNNLFTSLHPRRFPSKLETEYDIYVVEHDPARDWSQSLATADVTGRIERHLFTDLPAWGGYFQNTQFAWTDMRLPSRPHLFHQSYDIVLDFGLDGRYDPGVDIIDDLGVLEDRERFGDREGGFALVRRPARPGDFPVGRFDYQGGTFAPVIQDLGPPLAVGLRGTVYYPAQSAGFGTFGVPPAIHTAWSSYPLVVIAHGNQDVAPPMPSYRGFDYLGLHLASRGFICVSVDLSALDGRRWLIHEKAQTLLEHLRLIRSASDNPWLRMLRPRMNMVDVGLVGHSQGGEAAVAAQQMDRAAGGTLIKAIAALSPTDGKVFELFHVPGPFTPSGPYMMIYGTRDGDLPCDNGNCGIRVIDRAPRPRHMVVINGANHNFFNRNWAKLDGTPPFSRGTQEELANHFATSFFSAYLMRQQAYLEFLSGKSGDTTYATVITSDQPQRVQRLLIDDAEDQPYTETTNSLGLANVVADGATLVEESLRYHRDATPIEGSEEVEWGDTNSYHQDTRGMRITWSGGQGRLTVNVGDLDVSSYEYFAMRVGQRFRKTGSLNRGGYQDFAISLRDTAGTRSAKVTMNGTAQALPPPDDVGLFTKSIMGSVRLSLRELATQVDLEHLAAIELWFDVPWFTGEEVVPSQGELIFDDLELYGQNRTSPEAP